MLGPPARADPFKPALAPAFFLHVRAIRMLDRQNWLSCTASALELIGSLLRLRITKVRLGAGNPDFKKIYSHWSAFRRDQYLWFRVGENSFENFVYSQKM
jgi:hypothetical protein